MWGGTAIMENWQGFTHWPIPLAKMDYHANQHPISVKSTFSIMDVKTTGGSEEE